MVRVCLVGLVMASWVLLGEAYLQQGSAAGLRLRRDTGHAGLAVSGLRRRASVRMCAQEEDNRKVVLICTGDACEDAGARKLLKHARATIPEGLKCKSTGCLGMCGQGPAVGVEVTPGGAIEVKRDVTEESIAEIFAEALEASA